MKTKEVLVQIITSRLASLLSFLFSPFVAPIVAIFFLVRVYAQTWEQFALWTTINVLFITIIPFLYIYIQVKQGKLTDIHILIRGQRILPLLFAQISAIIGVFILYLLSAPKGLIYLGICYIVNGIVFILITQFWKISLHCGVVAGCVTALAYIVNPKMAFLFFLIPIVAWARIQKKRHTLIQTIAGAIIAIIVTRLTLFSL
jgi:membrane-associated phospholipid phosphatase